LRFIDREGIEAVPKDFPAREFPRWRDHSVVADDVRRLWPIETPIAAGKKRGPKTRQLDRVIALMRTWPRERLDAAKEEELALQFSASRDTCRKARVAVKSEIN
jgi:hypothetical protein